MDQIPSFLAKMEQNAMVFVPKCSTTIQTWFPLFMWYTYRLCADRGHKERWRQGRGGGITTTVGEITLSYL